MPNETEADYDLDENLTILVKEVISKEFKHLVDNEVTIATALHVKYDKHGEPVPSQSTEVLARKTDGLMRLYHPVNYDLVVDHFFWINASPAQLRSAISHCLNSIEVVINDKGESKFKKRRPDIVAYANAIKNHGAYTPGLQAAHELLVNPSQNAVRASKQIAAGQAKITEKIAELASKPKGKAAPAAPAAPVAQATKPAPQPAKPAPLKRPAPASPAPPAPAAEEEPVAESEIAPGEETEETLPDEELPEATPENNGEPVSETAIAEEAVEEPAVDSAPAEDGAEPAEGEEGVVNNNETEVPEEAQAEEELPELADNQEAPPPLPARRPQGPVLIRPVNKPAIRR